MTTSNISNRTETVGELSTDLPPTDAVASSAEPERSAEPRSWLFGAYAFLLIWGITYLVLFFTDRLPG